jgi:deoxyribodipyrimidine photo-lyase
LRAPCRAEFADFPWRHDERAFDAWARGCTGYPIVDAAARELLATGYVHNRGRMIAASFLTKHLLVDYRRGEAHYLRWLTDGDYAQNNFGWQWSAGCGCDAQPYFRVFNPELQAQRFDPTGAYVRRWVPEIGTTDYPPPIIDLAEGRARFLKAAAEHLGRNKSAARP